MTRPQLTMIRANQTPRADARQDEVARHLEQEIADEEQRGAEAVGGFAEAEIADHLQLGVADVLPVDIGDQVHEAEHAASGGG